MDDNREANDQASNAMGGPTASPAPEPQPSAAVNPSMQIVEQLLARMTLRVTRSMELLRQEQTDRDTRSRQDLRDTLEVLRTTLTRLEAKDSSPTRPEPISPSPAPRQRPLPANPAPPQGRRTAMDPGGELYDLYATPTGTRARSRLRDFVGAVEENVAPPQREEEGAHHARDLKTPFPKMDPRDIDMFFIEAEWWFRQNGIRDHSQMVAYTSQYLEGSAREWWKSKLRADREQEGILFHDWNQFTKRLREQYGQRDTRLDAFNEIQKLRMANDQPGTATRYVERFRDLDGRADMGDQELSMHLFRTGLSRTMQEKFERNAPASLWHWYQEVEAIDQQRGVNQQLTRAGQYDRDVQQRGGQVPMRPLLAGRTQAPASGLQHHGQGTPKPQAQPPAAARARPLHLAQRLPARSTPTTVGSTTCYICKGTGHWANNCPNKTTHAVVRPSGPRVGANAVVLDHELDHLGEPDHIGQQADADLDDQGHLEANEADFDLEAAVRQDEYHVPAEHPEMDDQGNGSGTEH